MKKIILPALSILCLSTSLALATDNTLTSYYPSASGNYDKLKAKKFTYPVDNNNVAITTRVADPLAARGDCSKTVAGTLPGEIVQDYQGNLMVCNNGSDGSTAFIPPVPTDTERRYWKTNSFGDLIPNLNTVRFGATAANGVSFVGFKRDNTTGDLMAVQVDSNNAETPLFTVGQTGNGIVLSPNQKLILPNTTNNLFIKTNASLSESYPIVLSNALAATGNATAKKIALNIDGGFGGIGYSTGGLELHGGGGTEPEVLVTSTGNVGINLGNGSPTHTLDVKGPAAVLKNSGANGVVLNQDGTIQMANDDATPATATVSVTTVSGANGAVTTTGGIKATTGDIEAVNGAVKGFIVVKSSGSCPGTCEDGTMWLE